LYKNKSVCVILPTYNEKDSIRKCIEDFYNTGFVDRVIVVNNNAAAGTSEEVAKTKALEVFETTQGVGAAVKRGLQETSEDIAVISEPDDTFCPQDIEKLLSYSKNFDAVWSSRTYTELIEDGANMGFFMILGNQLVAKLFQFLFNTTRLSDIGSSYRLLNRNAADMLKKKMTMTQNYYDVNLMFLLKINKFRFVEIPVNYKKRVGKSAVTGHFSKTLHLALAMIFWIIIYRIKSFFPFMKSVYIYNKE